MLDRFGDILIGWYQKNKRDLPWRGTSDPYKIWLSEVILQQTRVDQGLSYYLAFESRFPDVFSLAKASTDEVYKMWQGLGYYTRADNLMAAARKIVEDYQGIFPDDPDELLKIRGIGNYTAAAISSISFNVSVPVVDGNVFRVLSRIFGISTPIDSAKGKKEFQELAKQLMDDHPPAQFNQAMMEFGALYCKPSNPDCQHCIFFDICVAGKHNTTSNFPVKKPKPKIRHRYFYYFLVETEKDDHRSFVLKKRNEKDIWKNLYDMPVAEYALPVKPMESLNNDYFKLMIKDDNFKIISISEPYIHQLTHQKIHACFIRVIVDNLPFDPSEKSLLLVHQSELNKYPVPRLIERYLQDQELI